MSTWNSPGWETLLSGETCPICLRDEPLGVIAELDASYLTSGPDGPLWGYCTLVLKRHAVELHDIGFDEACRLMNDVQRAAAAIQAVTQAVKMNYEIHGNTIPHLHVHLFPRYRGDPFEGGPIDARRIRISPYREGEFEEFKGKLLARLRDPTDE